MNRLTPRATELMDYLVAHPGWTNDELAYAMGVSVGRVKSVLADVFRAYGVDSRGAAILVHDRLTRRRSRRHAVAPGQEAAW